MSTNDLIVYRTRKGFAIADSVALLEELMSRHEGRNLASALVYHSFATERGAEKFAGVA